MNRMVTTPTDAWKLLIINELAPQAGFEPATLRLTAGINGVSRALREFAARCGIERGARQNWAISDFRFVPAFVAPKGQEQGNVETHRSSGKVTAALIETPDRGGRRGVPHLRPARDRVASTLATQDQSCPTLSCQTRFLCGSPTFAHACHRRRELRLASHAKVVRRSLWRRWTSHSLSSALSHGAKELKSGAVPAVRLKRFPSNAMPSGKNSCCSPCL
jgi:hypothetical protein